MTTVWRDLLLNQLDFYRNVQLQPQLKGLTDDEYLWKPADDASSLGQIDEATWRCVRRAAGPRVTKIA